MINIKKLADRLEAELPEDIERLTALYHELYFGPYIHLNDIRELFDSTSYDDLKSLFNLVLEAETFSDYDDEEFKLGEPTRTNVMVESYWNDRSSSYYWQKIKRTKKGFF